jgi:hypothetical protein
MGNNNMTNVLTVGRVNQSVQIQQYMKEPMIGDTKTEQTKRESDFTGWY